MARIHLTYLNLAFYGTLVDSAEPDQTPQYAASDQVQHCLLTECTFKTYMKLKLTT